MKVLLVILFLSLFGCVDFISQKEIDGVNMLCKNHGGIGKIDAFPIHDNDVQCVDGTVFVDYNTIITNIHAVNKSGKVIQ